MRFLSTLAATGLVLVCSASVFAQELNSEKEKLGYVLGMDIGQSIKRMDIDMDRKALVQAINDVLDGKKTALTEQQANEIKMAFTKKKQEEAVAKAKEQAESNQKKGQEFLDKNKARDGVKVTASGLQYEVLTEGKGDKPKSTDKVKVHYKGTLLDGSVFDSSYDRNEPASFPLNGVIPGWTEGLQLMPVGSKFKFYIPASLAYGDRGAGNAIGPNEVLVFEVELLEILK